MEGMTIEQCQHNKDQCYKNNIVPIMSELKEIKNEIKDLTKTVLLLPQTLRAEYDEIYAKKELEQDVKDLKDAKNKSFSYWFDKIVQIISALLIAYLTFKMR
jgi:archaellum component FlaC